ncbi:hypothetical protein EBR96_10640 [bacterium]|nr:hypothetical protein [bacterium]
MGLVLIEILNERPKIEASPAAPVVDGLPVYGAGEPAYSPAASAPPASAARLSSSEREELAVRQVLKDADAENQALTAAGDEVLGRLHHEARVADTKRGAAARTTFIAEAMAAQVSRGTEQAEQAQRLSIEAEMKKAQATDRLASAVKRPTAE